MKSERKNNQSQIGLTPLRVPGAAMIPNVKASVQDFCGQSQGQFSKVPEVGFKCWAQRVSHFQAI